MLFLGGLNSILPYIVYLSLIWICLIIGFTGKIGGMVHSLTPKTIFTGQTALHQYDSKVIQYFDYSLNIKDNREDLISLHEPCIFQCPFMQKYDQPIHNDAFFNALHINTNWFRGPPRAKT